MVFIHNPEETSQNLIVLSLELFNKLSEIKNN